MSAPQFPAGPYQPDEREDPGRRQMFIAEIAQAPAKLSDAVSGLSAEQLDTEYRNWTIRQIAHHLADSHMHSYIRFKLALTEERPTIKPYDETRWSALDDARRSEIGPSLLVFEGLHGRWVTLLRALSTEQYQRTFFHPETGESVPLFRALGYYAWHCRHHIGQIVWLREQRSWRRPL